MKTTTIDKTSNPSGAAAAPLGRLVGASAALPAAGLVYVIASLNGVANETIVLRAVATGASVFLLAGWSARLIAMSVAREAARRRRAEDETR